MDEETREFLTQVADPPKPEPMVHVVQYHAGTVVFMERPTGARLMLATTCPRCKSLAMVHVALGHHSLSVDRESGKISLSPSLVCPQNCGFHVVVQNGVMRDA